MRRAEPLAHQPRRAAGPPRWSLRRRRARRSRRPRAASAAAASPSARSQETGAQLAAVADQRRGDALVDVDGLVGEAALVAQPAVVDLVVLAGEHAQDALVADGQRDVALRRAERADRAGVLDVPRARAEAVGARGERADRAQLDDVAAEGRDVGVPVEGRRRRSARRARAGPAGSPRRSPGEKRTQR